MQDHPKLLNELAGFWNVSADQAIKVIPESMQNFHDHILSLKAHSGCAVGNCVVWRRSLLPEPYSSLVVLMCEELLLPYEIVEDAK